MMREFTLALDQRKGTPLYEQLAQHVIAEIRAGRLPEGERLPSKRALAAHLGVSLNTVENAYQVLQAEGYVDSRPRSGYFACAYDAPIAAAPSAPNPEEVLEARDISSPFSTADVDTSAFPYQTWVRLYRQATSPELLRRGHPQGDIELREALAAFLHQYRGVSCRPDQIVIGAGFEYLMGLLIPLLGRERAYALEDPGYGSIYRTMATNGCRAMPIALDARGMMPDALAMSGASVCYVTPSHQFPTGITMPAGRRAQLLFWAGEGERYLIEDDYDSEFRHLTRPIPAMQGMGSDRVIYVGTFNRSIAPSIRVAYLVLPGALLAQFRQRFGMLSVTVSRFEQQALARFIAGGHYARHLRRMGALYRRRRDALALALGAIPGVSLSGHEAGLHFLLRHDALTADEMIARAGGRGIRLHALEEYAHGHPCDGNTLVIGYGALADERLQDLVQTLQSAWAEPSKPGENGVGG